MNGRFWLPVQIRSRTLLSLENSGPSPACLKGHGIISMADCSRQNSYCPKMGNSLRVRRGSDSGALHGRRANRKMLSLKLSSLHINMTRG